MFYRHQGLYWEDFAIGDRFETHGRTITDAENTIFTGLTFDHTPHHTDDEFAKTNPYGKRIAQGMLTMSIGLGLLFTLNWNMRTSVAHLGITTNFRAPVFMGDTIRTVAEVISKRETKKPDRGLVGLKYEILNQKGEVVCDGETMMMMLRKQS